jgi:glycogen operon protein
MLTAGDEFGRSQQGNNNAYAQDNPISWIDWHERDRALEDHVAELAAWRAARLAALASLPQPCEWLRLDGEAMTTSDWESPATRGLELRVLDPVKHYGVRIDGGQKRVDLT